MSAGTRTRPGAQTPAAIAGITLDEAATAADAQAMFSALETVTERTAGPMVPHQLALPLRDGEGAAQGGLWGMTLYRWLSIQILFVPEAMQRRGIGRALVLRAEEEACRRACVGAFVDTFDFQAEDFYLRLGYRRFGVLEQFPPGHRRIYLSKMFASA